MKQLKWDKKFWEGLIGYQWAKFLKEYLSSKEGQLFMSTLSEYYKTKEMYPFKKEVFSIFKNLNYSEIRVMIINEAPMNNGSSIPFANITPFEGNNPELRKVFESMMYPITYNDKVPLQVYNLITWIVQGVFMVNQSWTKSIENNQEILHIDLWKGFLNHLLIKLNELEETIFFLFIGNTKELSELITSHNHITINLDSPKESIETNTLWDVSTFYNINLYFQLHSKKIIEWINL